MSEDAKLLPPISQINERLTALRNANLMNW